MKWQSIYLFSSSILATLYPTLWKVMNIKAVASGVWALKHDHFASVVLLWLRKPYLCWFCPDLLFNKSIQEKESLLKEDCLHFFCHHCCYLKIWIVFSWFCWGHKIGPNTENTCGYLDHKCGAFFGETTQTNWDITANAPEFASTTHPRLNQCCVRLRSLNFPEAEPETDRTTVKGMEREEGEYVNKKIWV